MVPGSTAIFNKPGSYSNLLLTNGLVCLSLARHYSLV
jgi:hypothetical protein